MIRWKDGIKGAEVHFGFPWAAGNGILLSAQFLALTKWSPADQLASATAIYCLAQQIGQIVGTSGSTAALQQLFRLRLGVNLNGTPLPDKTEVSALSKYLDVHLRYSDTPFRSSAKFSKTTVPL